MSDKAKDNKRILIVDDNISIHNDFRRILFPETSTLIENKPDNLFDSFMDEETIPLTTNYDYEVDFADQGESAFKILKEKLNNKKPYALIFIDVRMPPGWDGIKTLYKIFEIDPDIQAVICSAYSDYSFFDLKEKFGLTDRILFLKKPFDSHEVLQLAASLTRKWNLAKENRANLIRLEEELIYRNNIENQLVQAQKMESIGQIAGGLAHDFNNILSGILGASTMNEIELKNEVLDIEKLNKYNRIILQSTERATILTNQLFALSRKHDFSPKPMDLCKSILNIIEIGNNIFDKRVEVKNKNKHSKCFVDADVNQIEQILLNISINASHSMTIMRKPSENHGGVLSYSLEKIEADEFFVRNHHEAKEGKYWKISISDTGVGMSTKLMTKIFDPFFTTKKDRKGTGLGLSMVYSIIKRHNGFIDVYSEENIGSNFNLYLPAIEDSIIESKETKNDLFHGSGTVLSIDDDEVVLNLSKSILEHHGFTVLTALNGKEGVDIYAKKHSEIAFVLMDMVMPVMSGKQTYIKMKKINPDIKVVLTSGFSQNDRINKILNLGVSAFI